ncbi:unnamed protein product, partial [Closterium sp. NIES-54]
LCGDFVIHPELALLYLTGLVTSCSPPLCLWGFSYLYPTHLLVHHSCFFTRQQRGLLRLAYVASEANTADIFTKALPPGDHQRLCTMLGFPTCGSWSSMPVQNRLGSPPRCPSSPTTSPAAVPIAFPASWPTPQPTDVGLETHHLVRKRERWQLGELLDGAVATVVRTFSTTVTSTAGNLHPTFGCAGWTGLVHAVSYDVLSRGWRGILLFVCCVIDLAVDSRG